ITVTVLAHLCWKEIPSPTDKLIIAEIYVPLSPILSEFIDIKSVAPGRRSGLVCTMYTAVIRANAFMQRYVAISLTPNGLTVGILDILLNTEQQYNSV